MTVILVVVVVRHVLLTVVIHVKGKLSLNTTKHIRSPIMGSVYVFIIITLQQLLPSLGRPDPRYPTTSSVLILSSIITKVLKMLSKKLLKKQVYKYGN